MVERPESHEKPKPPPNMWGEFRKEVESDEPRVRKEAKNVYKAIDERLARMSAEGKSRDAILQQEEFYKLAFKKEDFDLLCIIIGAPLDMPLGREFKKHVRTFQKQQLGYRGTKANGVIDINVLIDIDRFTKGKDGATNFIKYIGESVALPMHRMADMGGISSNKTKPLSEARLINPYVENTMAAEKNQEQKIGLKYIARITVPDGTIVYKIGARPVRRAYDPDIEYTQYREEMAASNKLSPEKTDLWGGEVAVVGVQVIDGKDYLRIVPTNAVPEGSKMTREEYRGAIRLLDPADANVRIVGSNGSIRIEPRA